MLNTTIPTQEQLCIEASGNTPLVLRSSQLSHFIRCIKRTFALLRPFAAATIGQCVSAGERGRGGPRKPEDVRPTPERNESAQGALVLAGRGDDIAVQVPDQELEKKEKVPNGRKEEEAPGCACVGRNGTGKVLDGQAKEAEGERQKTPSFSIAGDSNLESVGLEKVGAGRPLHSEDGTCLSAAESSAGASNATPGISGIEESAVQNETGAVETTRVGSPPRLVIPDESPGHSTHTQTKVPEFRSPPKALIIPHRFSFDSPHRPSLIPESPEIRQLKKRLSSSKIEADPVLASYFREVETSTSEHLVEEALGSPHGSAEDRANRPFNLPANHPANRRSFKTVKRLITLQDKEGNKYVNQYLILKPLGQGSHGKVKLSLNAADGCLYAMKIIDKALLRKKRLGSRAAENDAMREIAIMKRLAHPNIVALHEVIDDPLDDKLYMIIEYVEGGPVWGRSHQEPLPEHLARKYFQDVVRGLDYLHRHKIVHRDIKPENLLLAPDGTVKISDFGVSHVFEESDAMHRPVGTPAFLAPEACSSDTFRGRDLDVWALGVCLYLMVVGRLPFEAESVAGMYHRIVHEPLAFPAGTQLSPELVDLLTGILEKDPLRRLQLAQIMAHPWVNKQGEASSFPLQSTVGPVESQVTDELALPLVSR